MTDQQRGDCLGIAGHPHLLTPNLDNLAHEGARFTAAYSECPICIPARHTLMTGMAPSATGCVGWSPHQRIAQPENTLPNLLRLAGYQTAIVGRNMHQFPHSNRYGFEEIWDKPYADVYSRFHGHPRFSRRGSFDEWPHLMGHGLSPTSRARIRGICPKSFARPTMPSPTPSSGSTSATKRRRSFCRSVSSRPTRRFVRPRFSTSVTMIWRSLRPPLATGRAVPKTMVWACPLAARFRCSKAKRCKRRWPLTTV